MTQYIMSKFGPCERVLQENDYGIDFYCNLMERSGSVGKTGLLYGVQVKSGNEKFTFEGDHLKSWLQQYNIPMLMCRADRSSNKIILYSTWMLNLLLTESIDKKINQIIFCEEYGNEDGKLQNPQLKNGEANVWMGPPILEITVNELEHSKVRIKEILKILREWVSFDVVNYSMRSIGIPVFFGYINWETNKSLDTSVRRYFEPHVFNDLVTEKAFKTIHKCALLVTLNKKNHPEIIKPITDHLLKLDKEDKYKIDNEWYRDTFSSITNIDKTIKEIQ